MFFVMTIINMMILMLISLATVFGSGLMEESGQPSITYTKDGKYSMHRIKRTRDEASEVCEKRGGNLVVIDSHEEKNRVKGLIKRGAFYWIGLSDQVE